jgi:hypothetical protein
VRGAFGRHMVTMAMAAASAMRPLAPLFLFFFFSLAASASDNILANSSLADGQKLVSAGGVFELGFFTPPGSTTAARFLGIWYRDIDPPTVVWVANRDAPVSGTAGSLAVVVNGGGGGGGGRLVLGMKFGWDLTTGLDRYLTTWRSAGDPSPGDYTFKIDPRGAPEGFIWYNGTSPVYRNGPWDGLQFSGEPEMEPNNTSFRFEFVANRTDVYYTFVVDGGGGGGVLSRFVLNQSSAQRYVWLPQAGGWSLYWSLPRDQCDQYAHCGAYGVCDVGAASMCGCPAGFAPASPRNWELRDSSAGCARRTRLNCTGDGFLPLRGVKLPDTTNATVDAAIAVDQCRARCLANCSCVAYAASDVRGGGSGCIMWSSPLVDIRKFSYGGEDLFMRLAASDLRMILLSSLVRMPYTFLRF